MSTVIRFNNSIVTFIVINIHQDDVDDNKVMKKKRHYRYDYLR